MLLVTHTCVPSGVLWNGCPASLLTHQCSSNSQASPLDDSSFPHFWTQWTSADGNDKIWEWQLTHVLGQSSHGPRDHFKGHDSKVNGPPELVSPSAATGHHVGSSAGVHKAEKETPTLQKSKHCECHGTDLSCAQRWRGHTTPLLFVVHSNQWKSGDIKKKRKQFVKGCMRNSNVCMKNLGSGQPSGENFHC